jgi:hypothetical protein
MCRKPYGISVASGLPKDQAIMVTIQTQTGTVTDAFTFPPPVLTGVPVGNAPTIGAVSLKLTGVMIGFIDYCPRLRVGGTTAEAIGWISDSSLSGKVAAGTKATLVVDVTVGRRKNFLTQAASYDIPDIIAPRFSFYSAALGAFGLSPVL